MKTCTVVDVLSWGPCPDYTPEVVADLFAGRESLSVAEILDLDIPSDDRLWAVLRPEMLPEETLGELTCRFAEDVLPIYESEYPGDNRPRHAIEVKRRWLRGEATDDELAEARAAAEAVAGATARAAARAAAWVTAWATARATAWVAGATARATAEAAEATARAAEATAEATEATWEDAHERQVEMVREIVREVGVGAD